MKDFGIHQTKFRDFMKFTRGIFASIWPGEWKSGFQDQCGIFVGLAGLAISLECRGCIESMGVHFWGEAEALGIN